MAKKLPSLINNPTRRVNERIEPYIEDIKPVIPEEQINRGNEIDIEEKPFSVSLEDIDSAIFYYFKNIINPQVIQNGNKINVPVEYGSQERWASVQKNGYFRDKNGKIMYPYIMIRRSGLEKDRELSNKLDGNNVNNFIISKARYNPRNQYSAFGVLNNYIPSHKIYATAIPDYITLRYDCMVFTNFMVENNRIIEAIEFASDSYWGDENRFQFRTYVDSFDSTNEYTSDRERICQTSLSLAIHGYILPDSFNRERATRGKRQFYSKSVISISEEVVKNV